MALQAPRHAAPQRDLRNGGSFQDRRNRPLCHLSAVGFTLVFARSCPGKTASRFGGPFRDLPRMPALSSSSQEA